MLRTIKHSAAPQISRAVKTFIIFAALALAALPATAQTTSWLFEKSDALDNPLSPQAGRPDIQWIRGGHAGSQNSVSRSAGGQILATTSGDSTVKIWRSSDDALIRTIQPFGANGAIYRPAVSPDGTLVAVSGLEVSPNFLVKIFRVSDGGLVQTITGFNDYLHLAISPDNQYLLAGGSNTTVGKLYRISDGGFVRAYGNNYGFGGVAFSPNGQNVILASTFTNTNPALFETTTGGFVRSMSSYANSSFKFSPDGQYLAGSQGGGTFVFNVANGSGILLQSGASGGYTDFSPNGQYFAVGQDMLNVKIWQVSGTSTWAFLQQFQAEPVNTAGNATQVSFNSSNQLITTYASIKVWNPANGSFLRNISSFSGFLKALAFTADGQKLAVSNFGNLTNSLRLLNPTSGLPIVDFPQSYGLNVYQLAITPDGQRIVTIDSFDNRHFVKIWNAVDGSLIRNTELTLGGFLTVAAPDNQSYILAGHTSSGSFPATQYRISDGTVVRTFGSSDCVQRVLDISPDGSTLALNKYLCNNIINGGLFFYRVSDGALLRQIADPFAQGSNGAIQNGVFSPDGQTFAISAKYVSPTGPYPVYLFRISDGARIREFVGSQSSSDGIAFTPNGQNIAATSWDNTVRFWRISDSALLNTFDEETIFTNTDSLSSNIKFSPDGSRFVYARRDATAVMAANPYYQAQTPRIRFDFDGDGKADLGAFRPANGGWYIYNLANGQNTSVAFGQTGDVIVPADYDGDGKTDVAVFRSGTWYLNRTTSGFTGIGFGVSTDIPVPADYDGDGKADVAVFRPSTGAWYVQGSQIGFYGITFGQTGDRPVPADYDADGKADVAVYRAGIWYLNRSTAGFTGIQFGDANDKLVPADYDGDGRADVAVFRPSNGVWYLNRSQAGFTGIAFGAGTDIPAPADYDGDGKTDVAVFRDGTWYLQRSQAGFTGIAFGAATDTPVSNAYVR